MRLGDLVLITGGFDNRVRQHDETKLIIGTVDQLLLENQVSVLLESGDIWVGHSKFLSPADHQK